MKRLLPVLVVVFMLAGILALPVSAGSSPSTVTYTVQPGDTLTSISRQFCTSRQVIYALNKSTIGPDPNALEPGMVLQIPNGCGGSPPMCDAGGQCGGQPPRCNEDGQCGGQPPQCNVDGQCGGQPPQCSVYDRGPTLHARGSVQGNIYCVMLGDTSFSISRRFGLTVGQLSAANGIADPYRIYAGQTLVIPGLGSCPPPPGKPFVTISSPASGAQLPATFTVTGTGGGLFEGALVVRAVTSSGQVLAEVPTTLQGSNLGAGGTGTYSVQLSVHVSATTAGRIVATSTSPKDGSVVASAGVQVTFSAGPPPPKPFVTISSPAPGAQLPSTFTVSGTGGRLFEGSLVVRAVTGSGQVLAEVPATLQGSNVGAGGTGTYSVQITVHVTANTAGRIVAASTSPKDGSVVASASVQVTFTSSSPTYKDYAPGQCRIRGKPGAPFYVFPGGPQAGYFGSGGAFDAIRGAKASGETWYQISTDPGTGTPSVWVPSSSTTAASGGCAF